MTDRRLLLKHFLSSHDECDASASKKLHLYSNTNSKCVFKGMKCLMDSFLSARGKICQVEKCCTWQIHLTDSSRKYFIVFPTISIHAVQYLLIAAKARIKAFMIMFGNSQYLVKGVECKFFFNIFLQ